MAHLRHNISLMDTTPDQTRMTLRLPKDLREALELAVQRGASASVTAEIINRLRKSFELQPLNNSDPNDLIKQCAATILDTVEKLNNNSPQSGVSIKMTSTEISLEEKQLLEEFNHLPKHKRKMAMRLFLAMAEMGKSG